MAEIKSTLDLVMERTRGLTLTDREKDELRARELSGKIRAVLDKYIKEYQGMKWLETELAALGLNGNREVRQALATEVIGRLRPDGDNKKYLEILGKLLGKDSGKYRSLLAEYKRKLAGAKDKALQSLAGKLAQQNITGSAVIPNLDADPLWARESETILSEFRQRAGSL